MTLDELRQELGRLYDADLPGETKVLVEDELGLYEPHVLAVESVRSMAGATYLYKRETNGDGDEQLEQAVVIS